MRLFAAIVPPADALDHLATAVDPVRDDRLRWSRPDAWHLTLAFYGEVPDERLDELTERLHRAARRQQQLSLALSGAGRFDGRVLWVGCSGDLDGLRKLSRSCGAAGRRAGAAIDEQRRFRPHLTLARAATPVDLRDHVATLAGYHGPSWTASELALIRSSLGAGPDGRPRYALLASFKLAG